MGLFDKIPKKIATAIMLIKAIDVREAIQLTQAILYLWREFMIKTNITPVIKEYKVSFYYKDTRIAGTTIKELREVLKLIHDLEKMRGEK